MKVIVEAEVNIGTEAINRDIMFKLANEALAIGFAQFEGDVDFQIKAVDFDASL